MTDKYIDVSLTGGTTSTYLATADAGSRHTGGTDDGYETFATYWAARAIDDTVIFRSGSYTNTSQRTVDKTGMTIRNYEGETATLTTTANVVSFLLSNAITIDGGYQGGKLHLTTNATTAGNAVIKPNASNLVIKNITLTSTSAAYLVRYNDPSDDNLLFDQVTFVPGTNDGGIYADAGVNGAVGETIFNSCIIDGCGVLVSRDVKFTFNNCIHRAPNSSNSNAASINLFTAANAVIILNNPLAFGTGAGGNEDQLNFKQAGASTFNVNGGVVNGNFHQSQETETGTVTYDGNTVFNKLIRFSGYGADRAIITLTQKDSSFSVNITPTYLPDYVTMLTGKNAKMSWYPDDSQLVSGYSQDRIDRVNSWIDAGHEMGSVGYSSDSKANASPFSVAWGGAGTGTVVITGNSLELKVDDVTSDTFDLTRSFDDDGVIGLVAANHLITSINAVADWTVTYAAGTTLSWDDTLSYVLEDGTYDSGEAIPFDTDERWQEEVEASNSDWYTIVPTGTVTTMNSDSDAASASYKAYVTSSAMDAFYARSLASPVNEIMSSSTDLFNHILVPMGLSLEGDASQDQIEQAARVIATDVLFTGSYIGLGFPNAGSGHDWTATEAGYLVDELLVSGVDLMTCSAASTWIAANGDTVSNASPKTGLQKSGSAGVGIGIKWWGTDPRPDGIDGEPYPDTDIDCGPSQSTLSSNHPANL